MTNILDKDIDKIIKEFDMSVFENKTILITGATGLLGKVCAMSLLSSGYHTKVIALVRDKAKADKIFSKFKNIEYLVSDIKTPLPDIKENVNYIIHTASVTSSRKFLENPVETIDTAYAGTKNILEFARKKHTQGVIYLSSLEVYGVQKKENISEQNYGYIDILNPRSSYPESKRLVENLCISYGYEYGVPVKIARLAQTFGAGVSKEDNRVFAQFAKSVLNKSDIILHTEGNTMRNYCYTTDAVTAIFTILTKGEPNSAYNVANKKYLYINKRHGSWFN